MTTMSWKKFGEEAENGVVTGVPAGTYVVTVDAVRVHKNPEKRLLYLDLLIEAGPLAGKIVQVNLYIPEHTNKGAMFHYRAKTGGFRLQDVYDQMEAADPDGTNIGAALQVLADALVGQRVVADLAVRTDGEFKGTNELSATRPAEGPALGFADDTNIVTQAARPDDTSVPVAVLSDVEF